MKYGQAFTESMKTAAGRALDAPDLGMDDLARAIKARRAAGKNGAPGVVDATNRLRGPVEDRLAADAWVVG